MPQTRSRSTDSTPVKASPGGGKVSLFLTPKDSLVTFIYLSFNRNVIIVKYSLRLCSYRKQDCSQPHLFCACMMQLKLW